MLLKSTLIKEIDTINVKLRNNSQLYTNKKNKKSFQKVLTFERETSIIKV